MLHSRFVVAHLSIGDVDVPLRHGDLVVAARAESAQLDWEAVVHTIGEVAFEQRSHALVMNCITGADDEGRLTTATMTGDAILVRAVDNALVFRGNGSLDGFDIGTLRG